VDIKISRTGLIIEKMKIRGDDMKNTFRCTEYDETLELETDIEYQEVCLKITGQWGCGSERGVKLSLEDAKELNSSLESIINSLES
jgi:hypothetical protein